MLPNTITMPARPFLVLLAAALTACGSDPAAPAEPTPPEPPTPSPLERPVDPAHVAWLAANVHPLREIRPTAGDDFADLEPLRAAIGDARVVLLGEQSHGDGATFLAKARLVEFLHQRMGFDVLVWESGLFELHRAWQMIRQGHDPTSTQRNAIYGVWMASEQTAPIVEYVASQAQSARPLELAGIDLQPSNHLRRLHLWTDLEAYAEGIGAPRDDRWWPFIQRVTAHSQLVVEDEQATPAERQEYLARLDALRALSLERAAAGDREALFWSQMFESMGAHATRVWTTDPGTDASVALRDAQMADNLIFLADEYYPGRKLIVWAATYHVAGDLAPMVDPFTGERPLAGDLPMGRAVREHFGSDAYALGFTAYDGTIGLPGMPAIALGAAHDGMLEDLLSRAGRGDAFLDLRGTPGDHWLRRPMIGRFIGHSPLEGQWPDVLDGLLYLRRMTPSTRSPE